MDHEISQLASNSTHSHFNKQPRVINLEKCFHAPLTLSRLVGWGGKIKSLIDSPIWIWVWTLSMSMASRPHEQQRPFINRNNRVSFLSNEGVWSTMDRAREKKNGQKLELSICLARWRKSLFSLPFFTRPLKLFVRNPGGLLLDCGAHELLGACNLTRIDNSFLKQ